MKNKKHPSYGKISISRFSSNRVEFFNSDLYHSGGINLTISKGSVERRHGSEHVYSEEDLIQVRMSNSQFIDAITSGMNTDGVPCTIERVLGENIPSDQFVQPSKDKFRGDMKDVYSGLLAKIKSIETKLSQPTLGKRKIEEIKGEVDTLKRHLVSNTNFTMKTFEESMERSVQEAKQSIANYIDHKTHTLGVQALRDQFLIEMFDE